MGKPGPFVTAVAAGSRALLWLLSSLALSGGPQTRAWASTSEACCAAVLLESLTSPPGFETLTVLCGFVLLLPLPQSHAYRQKQGDRPL